MRNLIYGAAAAVIVFAAQAGQAQSGIGFGGVRGAIQMGASMFNSEATHDTRAGFGGEVGADATVTDKISVGVSATAWLTLQDQENARFVTGGRIFHKSFNEYAVTGRVGYAVMPDLLLYGTGGFAWNDQRRAYVTPVAARGYSKTYTTNGITYGVGAEYALGKLFFVDAQVKRTDYYHTARTRATLGLGVRFK